MARRLGTLLSSLTVSAVCALALAAAAAAGTVTPGPGASPNADDASTLYTIVGVVALAIVLAVNLALLYAVGSFRARRERESSQIHGNARVQGLAATVAAAGSLAVLALGFAFLDAVRDPEPSGPDGLSAAANRTAQRDLKLSSTTAKDALRVKVSGQQWLWRFEYPDATFSYHELVVPVDTTVLLDIRSVDVVHTWWVPALGGKFDAVPGTLNRTWFKADRKGTYEGRSTTLSGPAYATMRARVRVVDVPEYKSWLTRQKADIGAAQAAVQDGPPEGA